MHKKCWLLSPSHLGWPVNRPRLYTLLVRREDSILYHGGLKHIEKLYRVPSLTMKDMMIAPEVPWLNMDQKSRALLLES